MPPVQRSPHLEGGKTSGPAAKATIAWSLKSLGRGFGGSLARPMMVAMIAALLPLRIGRSS